MRANFTKLYNDNGNMAKEKLQNSIKYIQNREAKNYFHLGSIRLSIDDATTLLICHDIYFFPDIFNSLEVTIPWCS